MRMLARAFDRYVSRGRGYGPDVDPYGPPLGPAEAARLVEAVRTARLGPGLRPPLLLPEGGEKVEMLLHPPARGHAWAVVAPPYGAFPRPGRFGVYRAHLTALSRAGFGVAAFSLPYHGSRAPTGKPSGWGFVRADLGHTARAVAAAASEAAGLARWLREERGASRVVGLGMSLGGAAIGLAAALGAPFDRLALLAAVDNCASFYATGRNREARRRTLAAAGAGPPAVEAAFRAVAPSTYPPPKERTLFAIPPEDLVVPAEAQRAWCAAWNGTAMELGWRGHAWALIDPWVARRVAGWLAEDGQE